MNYKEFTFKSEDGKEIYGCRWIPAEKPCAIIQIAHGMSEHINRYGGLAKTLTASGYAVYGNDHRGHGKTEKTAEDLGYFADENGWDKVIVDMNILSETVKKDFPGIPIFLFGHSMGSLLSRDYIMRYGNNLKGVILSGTAGDPGLLGILGTLIAKNEINRNGRKTRSAKLNTLSFGSFNSAFKPNRTASDWLSRDDLEVDKYINDPLCGGIFTTGFFNDFLFGISKINKKKNIEKIPYNLPIYLFSGDKDPVGRNTKGVLSVYRAFKKAGISDVQIKFYKDGRHEMLNEINKEEVHKDIKDWLKSKC